MLLAAGLSEADVSSKITARDGGPHFVRGGGEEGARQTLTLLRRLGLNTRQVTTLLERQPTLVQSPHSNIAAAVAWFQGKARPGGRDAAAAAAKEAPGLLSYTVAALEANWDNLRRLLGGALLVACTARCAALSHPCFWL